MKIIQPFNEEHLEAISRILADANTGLTGSEIGYNLIKCDIRDVDPKNTKWIRLYNAFIEEQNKKQYGNHVVAFIHKSMRPVTHTNSPGYFETKRSELNKVLSFSGLYLREDGRIAKTEIAKTIKEAEERANRLETKLRDRDVHQDVLPFCNAELLQENYFHAVLEACKSVANKIRSISGLSSDGARLADEDFSFNKENKPLLTINNFTSATEKSEQLGFLNLLKGLFGTFRNPTAHAEKIYWPIDEQEALDILSLVSLIHRKLDKSKKL